MTDWNSIQELIGNAQRILLATHENPDGDGLGCASAMQYYLSQLGKESKILCTSELPVEYAFLANAADYSTYNSNQHDEWISTIDLAIVFDVGDYRRLRDMVPALKSLNIPKINIDHHAQLENGFFSHNLIDLNTAATGEMLYEFFKSIYPEVLPKPVAEGLYTAVLTDTGSFRYSNTTVRCHEVAIDCIKAGIEPHAIYQSVYESSSVARIKLLGKVLNGINFELDGKLGWFKIDGDMLAQCSATKADVDGFTDFIRTIRGVEVALMVFQNGVDTCRINLRSKGRVNIHGVATGLGGGGHPFAAGAVIHQDLDSAIKKAVSLTRKAITDHMGSEG